MLGDKVMLSADVLGDEVMLSAVVGLTDVGEVDVLGAVLLSAVVGLTDVGREVLGLSLLGLTDVGDEVVGSLLGIAVVPLDVGADMLLEGKLGNVAVSVEVVGADMLGDKVILSAVVVGLEVEGAVLGVVLSAVVGGWADRCGKRSAWPFTFGAHRCGR